MSAAADNAVGVRYGDASANCCCCCEVGDSGGWNGCAAADDEEEEAAEESAGIRGDGRRSCEADALSADARGDGKPLPLLWRIAARMSAAGTGPAADGEDDAEEAGAGAEADVGGGWSSEGSDSLCTRRESESGMRVRPAADSSSLALAMLSSPSSSFIASRSSSMRGSSVAGSGSAGVITGARPVSMRRRFDDGEISSSGGECEPAAEEDEEEADSGGGAGASKSSLRLRLARVCFCSAEDADEPEEDVAEAALRAAGGSLRGRPGGRRLTTESGSYSSSSSSVDIGWRVDALFALPFALDFDLPFALAASTFASNSAIASSA